MCGQLRVIRKSKGVQKEKTRKIIHLSNKSKYHEGSYVLSSADQLI